jgi:hypothetical protein
MISKTNNICLLLAIAMLCTDCSLAGAVATTTQTRKQPRMMNQQEILQEASANKAEINALIEKAIGLLDQMNGTLAAIPTHQKTRESRTTLKKGITAKIIGANNLKETIRQHITTIEKSTTTTDIQQLRTALSSLRSAQTGFQELVSSSFPELAKQVALKAQELGAQLSLPQGQQAAIEEAGNRLVLLATRFANMGEASLALNDKERRVVLARYAYAYSKKQAIASDVDIVVAQNASQQEKQTAAEIHPTEADARTDRELSNYIDNDGQPPKIITDYNTHVTKELETAITELQSLLQAAQTQK